MTQTFERNNFLGRTYTGTGGGVFPTPVLLQYEQFAVDRSRLGLNGAIQFEIAPEFTITADALYSKLKTGRRQDFFAFRLPTGNNPVTNRVVDDGMVVAGNANGTVTTAGQIRNEPTESFLYGLNGKYEGDNGLTIEADGYYSKGTIDQAIQIITLQGTALVPGAFDFRDVVQSITEKLIRRHPHDFGDARNLSPDEVKGLWDRINSGGCDYRNNAGIYHVQRSLPTRQKKRVGDHLQTPRGRERRGVDRRLRRSGNLSVRVCCSDRDLNGVVKSTAGI